MYARNAGDSVYLVVLGGNIHATLSQHRIIQSQQLEDQTMSKYLFVYHGGTKPDTEAEVEKVMAAWGQWFGSMGADVVDGGNPVGMSSTVASNGSVVNNGGANPVSGYSLVEASSLDDALAKAKGCPILAVGGSIEVAATIDM